MKEHSLMMHGKGKLTRVVIHRSNSDAIFETGHKWWVGACGERIAGYHKLDDYPRLPDSPYGYDEENEGLYLTNETIFQFDPDDRRELPYTCGDTIKGMKLI